MRHKTKLAESNNSRYICARVLDISLSLHVRDYAAQDPETYYDDKQSSYRYMR